MRKLIAAINMTLDGFCDHNAIIPDEELHDHYTALINNGGAILYGRITYLLMEYWLEVIKNPTGIKAQDEFAAAIDKIPKIVFSRTLQNVAWENARVATRDLKEEVSALRQQPGKDILVGSRSLIISLLNLNLIDEFQLTVHPITAGKGLPLFEKINKGITLKLVNTKTFANSGSISLYYEPTKK